MAKVSIDVNLPMGWDDYFGILTRIVAQKSQDENSKFGALIVDSSNRLRSSGYNGIPRGIPYQSGHHQRPDKYAFWVHAEQNAIFNAASIGTSTDSCTMYVVKPPCAECVKAIIQSGITQVIYLDDHVEGDYVPNLDRDNWRLTLEAAGEMLAQSGVRIRKVRQ